MTERRGSPTSHRAGASMAGYLYQARYALLRGLQEGRKKPRIRHFH